MAEYTPNFESLDAALDYFGHSAELGLPLRARLQTKFGPENNRSSSYNSLLKVSENYLNNHKGLSGRNARQLAIDALALSDDPDRTLSAIDDMVIEIAENYAELLKKKTNPTASDKDSAAEQSMDKLYKLFNETTKEGFIKIPYLERFLDLYIARLSKPAPQQEAPKQDQTSPPEKKVRAVS